MKTLLFVLKDVKDSISMTIKSPKSMPVAFASLSFIFSYNWGSFYIWYILFGTFTNIINSV